MSKYKGRCSFLVTTGQRLPEVPKGNETSTARGTMKIPFCVIKRYLPGQLGWKAIGQQKERLGGREPRRKSATWHPQDGCLFILSLWLQPNFSTRINGMCSFAKQPEELELRSPNTSANTHKTR